VASTNFGARIEKGEREREREWKHFQQQTAPPMITRVTLNGIQHSYASNDTVKWGFRLSRDITCAANFISIYIYIYIYIYTHTHAPNCLVSWLAVSEKTIVKRRKSFLTPVFFLLLRVFWSFYYDFLIHFFNYQIAPQSTWLEWVKYVWMVTLPDE
jgi:hypothetical protein